MVDLLSVFIENGLLQFGYFESSKPYCLSLELLPSYPDVLHELVRTAVPLVGQVDHLVSTSEATAFGVGLSLHNQLPLVYSRGGDKAPVHDLVGAYDIGHPSMLVATQPTVSLERLVKKARTVGLDIQSILVIVDDGEWQPDTLPLLSLIQLSDAIDELVADCIIPVGQAQAVRAWINHHPDLEVP